jgi:hypothetical protein
MLLLVAIVLDICNIQNNARLEGANRLGLGCYAAAGLGMYGMGK